MTGISRVLHKQSFEIVCDFIDEFILQKNEVYVIKELNKLYMAALGDLGGIECKDVDISSDTLAKKINDKYGEQVAIEKGQTKKGNLIYSSQLDHSEFIRALVSDETKTQAKIRNVAYKLREIIMETEKHPLPERLTVDDIIKGETDVPETLFQFFNNLVCGPDKRRGSTEYKTQRVKSICQDVIFAATAGKRKPSKHLVLGMVIKSLTGSKKAIDILNRLGHTICYSTVEELETEIE